MAQTFPGWTNRLPLAIAVAVPVGATAAVLGVWYFFAPQFTDVGYMPEQPVSYSHRLHAGDMGMDCRYCHSTVERANMAAIPATSVCMNCHAQVRPDSPLLQPLRDAWVSDMPVRWSRVHLLPDYAYFDHSAHVGAGVGCSTCHGRVDQMDEVSQQAPLSMVWCLDCHRDPTPVLRPHDQVTNMAWDTATADYDPHSDPNRTRELTPPLHCSGCHR